MPEENQPINGGVIHISEDVIAALARKTIQGIPNIKTASKLSSKFGLGRKSGGIKVSVDQINGVLNIDAYVLIKYGQRIPDLAWDVQEKIKDNLERYTGYIVKAVNVNIQGIYSDSESDEKLKLDIEKENNETDDEEE